jgi:hypothetical protein
VENVTGCRLFHAHRSTCFFGVTSNEPHTTASTEAHATKQPEQHRKAQRPPPNTDTGNLSAMVYEHKNIKDSHNETNVMGDHAVPGMGFGLSSCYVEELTCNSKGKPPDTPNAPYRAACGKDEKWRSALRREVALGAFIPSGIRIWAGRPEAALQAPH